MTIANAKFGTEIIRNAPTVDTLSVFEFALDAAQQCPRQGDDHRHGLGHDQQRQRSRDAFDDQVADGRSPVLAELDAEIALRRTPPSQST